METPMKTWLVVDLERHAHRIEDALRQTRAIARLHDIRLEQGEFVAAEPGEMIAGAQHLRQPPRERHDQPVADIVTERIVGLLEMIEIEIEQGKLMPAAAAACNLRIDEFVKQKPVGQTG